MPTGKCKNQVSLFCYFPTTISNTAAIYDSDILRKAQDKAKWKENTYVEKKDVSIAQHMFNTHPLTSDTSHLLLALLHVYLTYTLEVAAVPQLK